MSEQGIWLAVLAMALVLPVALGAAAHGPRSLRRRRPRQATGTVSGLLRRDAAPEAGPVPRLRLLDAESGLERLLDAQVWDPQLRRPAA